ncbi:MAG: von Willebrand factor type A domain-containing protein [Bacteroidia bacterium]
MQKNIDQQFQEAIGRLEGNPEGVHRDPEALWGRIESGLNQDRKKRRVAVAWVSIAAGVAIAIVVGWTFLPKDQGSASGENLALLQESSSDQPQPDNMIGYAVPTPAINDPQEQQVAMDQAANSPDIPSANAVTNVSKVTSNDGSTTLAVGAIADNSQSFTTNAPSHAYTFAWTSNINKSVGNAQFRRIGDRLSNGTEQQYRWDFGDGKANNQAFKGGAYKVVVTDANGCKTSPKGFLSGQLELLRNKGYADSVTVGFNEPYGSESYAETVENDYFKAIQEPLSTFSIDVDRASYTNHRRFIESGQLPPKYSVRAEEFINYFHYDYEPPHTGDPFSILPEVASCPWNPSHKLVRIALKGREVPKTQIPASNLVFLLDVSGSMDSDDKLGLLKKAMVLLTNELREQDRVSIVVYAGAAGLVLPPTSGIYKNQIIESLDKLTAGGSTAGGEGIELAYATAKQHYIKGGNNRVILATDGDFNVGVSDETGLERLIEKKREEGVFLSVLGFGEGNLQDSKMELLADKGNGNYNYIDSEREANKVLVSEFGGTLYTIAKDVKIQVEFNPARVETYRLVGYENRKLKNEDFENDRIDAGELGAGHTVTALYEVVPAGSSSSSIGSQDLKYSQRVFSMGATSGEILTVKLRYKDPDGSVSKLLTKALVDDGRNIAQTSDDFRWATAAAEYALILRQSAYKGMASYEQVLALARSAVGRDKEGYRKEFISLVERAMGLTQNAKANQGNR